MSNLSRRLDVLEAQHTRHIEALADTFDKAFNDVLKHVPDEPLRLIANGKLVFTDDAQWYACLAECGVSVELVERLKRADDALLPYVESPTYKAWQVRNDAQRNTEIAALTSEGSDT